MTKKELYELWIEWQKTAKLYRAESYYYRKQLVDAHTMIGRIIHQISERESIRLSEWFPTDNKHHKRNFGNPSGGKNE